MEGKWEKRKAKRDGEENGFSLAWMREEKGEEKKVGDNAPFHPQLFSPHKERYGGKIFIYFDTLSPPFSAQCIITYYFLGEGAKITMVN